MNWIEVSIFTETAGIDMLCSRLTDVGIRQFAIQDANDFDEFLNSENPKWDYIDDSLVAMMSDCETKVTVYLPDNNQGAEMMLSMNSVLSQLKCEAAECGYNWGRLTTECSKVRESDWADNWKRYFKPLKIGKRLVIKPSWEQYSETGDRTVLELDPASSFGTGQHHTTRLCLELLEKAVRKNDSILDLGCGSGILSVAGILLGA